MIIISHDRHFLNSVCTHMADLDFGELRIYPGNYDEYMTASTQVRERLLSDNAKKKTQINELQAFVSRFSANASKAKQATSRARQIDKIQLEEVKPSSRVSPISVYARTRSCIARRWKSKALTKGYGGEPVFSGLDLQIEVGERVAIIGASGIGKTTLLRTLMGELHAESGSHKWSENAKIGYYAQDHSAEFTEDVESVFVDGAMRATDR